MPTIGDILKMYARLYLGTLIREIPTTSDGTLESEAATEVDFFLNDCENFLDTIVSQFAIEESATTFDDSPDEMQIPENLLDQYWKIEEKFRTLAKK